MGCLLRAALIARFGSIVVCRVIRFVRLLTPAIRHIVGSLSGRFDQTEERVRIDDFHRGILFAEAA